MVFQLIDPDMLVLSVQRIAVETTRIGVAVVSDPTLQDILSLAYDRSGSI